ncbi:Guanosine-3',5'-bis(diphosphate) 3'-pyrophosphohydrolase [compost metagenome]
MTNEMTSRTKYLEQCLKSINSKQALKAFYLVINVMNAKNGYTRHNGTDYFLHLIDVTQILFNYGIKDDDILAAALLHDIVEDCYKLGYTLDYIVTEFNSRIAEMVDLVTKKPGIDYKIAENMTAYLEAIFWNIGSALIKAADRIHNFGTLGDATRAKINKQACETKTFFIPFFKRCRNEYPQYSGFFFAAKTTIEPHLHEIETHEETFKLYENRIKYLEKKLLISQKQMSHNIK